MIVRTRGIFKSNKSAMIFMCMWNWKMVWKNVCDVFWSQIIRNMRWGSR